MRENSAAVPSGRRCIVVTGMHRSGTSAAVRVMNLLGAILPDHLVGADDGNPLGHWEPAKVIELNDRLLSDVSKGWDDVSAIDWTRVSTEWFAGAVASACDVLRADYPTADLFAVKDPRISRLLPVWRAAFEQLGIEPLLVHCLRNPLEVAQSLKSRDGMTPSYGLLLWARYALDCQIHGHGLRQAVLAYDDLLEDWRRTMAGIEASLGLSLPVSSDAAVAIGAFLTPKMRHHRHGSGDTADDLPATVTAILAAAREPRPGATPEALRDLSDRLDAEGADPTILREEIAARARRARRMRLEMMELRSYIGVIQPEVEELRVLISRQARSEGLADTAAAPAATADMSDDVRSQIDALNRQVTGSLTDIGQGIASIERRIDRLQRTEDEHRIELQSHQDRAPSLLAALNRAQAELNDATARIETLAASCDALRADLATAQQERDAALARSGTLETTREGLETLQRSHDDLLGVHDSLRRELETTRAALAAAERRVDQLSADLNSATLSATTALDRPATFGRGVGWRRLTTPEPTHGEGARVASTGTKAP